MSTNSVTDTEEADGVVCGDGFDKVALLAACRSVGYTPGPNASFTFSAAVSTSYIMDNVSCPPGAHFLTDCSLNYIGPQTLSASVGACGGGVLLDCDLGTPSIEFRKTNGYLQARLFSDAEWGWVSVGKNVTSSEATATMCNYVNSTTTADYTVAKSFLSVLSCPSGATSITKCNVEYTNGAPFSYFYYYSCRSAESTGNIIPTSASAALGPTLALALGIPAGFLILVAICVFLSKKLHAASSGTTAAVDDHEKGIEMASTHFTTSGRDFVPYRPPPHALYSVEGAGDTDVVGGENIYESPTTIKWNAGNPPRSSHAWGESSVPLNSGVLNVPHFNASNKQSVTHSPSAGGFAHQYGRPGPPTAYIPPKADEGFI